MRTAFAELLRPLYPKIVTFHPVLMTRTDTVIAVIPAYNAERFVLDVVRVARQHVVVIAVNDGSRDNTLPKLMASGATVIDQQPNQGKGAALKRGFRAALEQGAGAVIQLDADGQHDASEIPLFLAKFRETGADLIIGERDFTRMPFVRRLSNNVGQRAFNWALGKRIADNQSGYRLLSRRLVEAVLASDQGGFEFELDMIVISFKRGWRIDGVPIATIYGEEKSNIQPVQHVLRFFRMVGDVRRAVRR